MAKVKAIKLQRIMITFFDDGEPDQCIIEGYDVTRTDGKKGAVTEEVNGRFAEARKVATEPGIQKAVKAVIQLLHADVTGKRTR